MPEEPRKKLVPYREAVKQSERANGLDVYRLTAVQRVVTWLTIVLLASIFLVMIYVCCDWHNRMPLLPSLTGTDATEQLSRYREACEIVKDNETGLFDTLVTHTILPVTVALIGFLIGTKVARREDGE